MREYSENGYPSLDLLVPGFISFNTTHTQEPKNISRDRLEDPRGTRAEKRDGTFSRGP
jgi:hypothetical protein